MRLFLLRHAAAANSVPDSARPLNETGEAQIKALVPRLSRGDFSNLAQIWHSTYERAGQTARRLSALMGLEVPLVASAALVPMGDPAKSARMAAGLAGMGGDLLVVGHNPHLEDLAALLLTGSLRRPVVRFDNCSLLCLELIEEPDVENEYGVWLVAQFLP